MLAEGRNMMGKASRLVGGMLLMMLLGGGCTAHPSPGSNAIDDRFLDRHGIRYWLAVKDEPRILRIHHLRIDLGNPRIELAAALARDPDGNGPATAELEQPLSIAQRARAIALVNANRWQGVPDAHGQRSTNWHEGMAVQIEGLAAAGGGMRSPPAGERCEFWLDGGGRAHIGPPPQIGAVRDAVAGLPQLLDHGRVLPEAGGAIHPRTAVGLDASGRWLYVVVVDGRQPGYSMGMNLRELAEYMRGLGCYDAVNLDGGGSSIMVLADAAGTLHLINDPSTKERGVSVARPIPVALVVKEK
jgi:hypothetical protein